MAVRNFWVEASIEGYKTQLKGGPRGKEQGMMVRLYQRNRGEIETAISVICSANGNELVTHVYVDGVFMGEYKTVR